MKRVTKSDRREHPRLDHRLPVKIVANGYDLETTTENVSCLGAYCRISKYIPPFTRIMVKLCLPMPNGVKSDLECKGVIVRSTDEEKGGFNIAVYFNSITEAQKHKISQYINRFLPQASATLQS